MAIFDGNVAKMIRDSILHSEELQSLKDIPENKLLADELLRLESVIEMLNKRLDSLPGRPNQWNPHG